MNDLTLVSQALSGSNEFGSEVVKSMTTDVAQFDALEILPDPLIRIEIRSIAGQLLQMQAFGRPRFEKVDLAQKDGVNKLGC